MTRDQLYVRHLREQAQRCYRTALRIADPELADRLTEIGDELEEEADALADRVGRCGRVAPFPESAIRLRG